MKRLGKPDTGNPSVRFDEGSESDGHWRKPFNPSAPAYSTTGFLTVGFPYIERRSKWVHEYFSKMLAGDVGKDKR